MSESPENVVIGAATCDTCGVRIKVSEKNRPLIGKAVRCPKCRSFFVLNLETPSVQEQAAINAEETRTQQAKRKRRSKDEVRASKIADALSGFKALHARLQKLAQEEGNKEEQVRIWCVDALRTALGYKDDEIETERKVLNGRIDIAIKKEDRVTVVVECKAIRSRLGPNVLEQAGTYAATLSANWVVLTVGDSEKAYHSVVCKNSVRLRNALFSDRVVKSMKQEIIQSYQDEFDTKVSIDDDEMLEALRDEFDLSEL